MAKLVRYNGRRDSSSIPTNPRLLEVGKVYKVDTETKSDYTLVGLQGYFSTLWFNEVNPKEVYIAYTNRVPEIGLICECRKIEFHENKLIRIGCTTATVLERAYLGNGIYVIRTPKEQCIIKVCDN